MINRYFYKEEISVFINSEPEHILGVLAQNNSFNLLPTQRNAWLGEIDILQKELGKWFFKIKCTPIIRGAFYSEFISTNFCVDRQIFFNQGAGVQP